MNTSENFTLIHLEALGVGETRSGGGRSGPVFDASVFRFVNYDMPKVTLGNLKCYIES